MAYIELLGQAGDTDRPQKTIAQHRPYCCIERRLSQNIAELKDTPALPPGRQDRPRIGGGRREGLFQEHVLSRAKRRLGDRPVQMVGNRDDNDVNRRVL